MGQVRKIGEEYYIEFYARGLLYQQKGGNDIVHAQKLLDEIEGKIKQGEMGTIVRDVDLDIFLKTFSEFAQKEYSSKTFSRYSDTIKHFSEFLKKKFPGLKKLSEVTPKVIEDYRFYLSQEAERRKLKPKVLNFTLYLLRDCLDYGITLGYINDNPTLHVRLFSLKGYPQPNINLPRNAFIYELCKKGIPLLTIGKRLGFLDIARVMRYSAFVEEKDISK